MRPTGNDAVKFLEKWNNAKGNNTLMAGLAVDYRASHRQLRGWVDYIRKDLVTEYDEMPEPPSHKNQFVKEGSNPTSMIMKCQGTGAVINDPHFPYEDPKVMSLVLKFLFDIQPEYLFINGDWWDLYQLSRFDRNPNRVKDLDGDIKKGKRALYKIRRGLPNTQIVFIDGNHEDRLRKFIWRNTPELESIGSLSPDELFGFIDLEIDYVPKHKILEVNNLFKIEHGDVVRKWSGWTAKAHYEKRGGSGICAHSHRGGSFFKHDSGFYGWWENFCLCTLYPEWTKNPDWMHGFSLVHFKRERFWTEQIPIIDYRFIYGGEMYG